LVLTCSPTPSFPSPARCRRRASLSKKFLKACSGLHPFFRTLRSMPLVAAWLRDTILCRCADGYRFAKRQGKPNSANLAPDQQNKGFFDLADCAAPNPFRFDSSRTLNCSSNLIGHDHANKPANGGGEDTGVQRSDRSRARKIGRQE
jgi:hypothetical protein